jgi:hypothetical protein
VPWKCRSRVKDRNHLGDLPEPRPALSAASSVRRTSAISSSAMVSMAIIAPAASGAGAAEVPQAA